MYQILVNGKAIAFFRSKDDRDICERALRAKYDESVSKTADQKYQAGLKASREAKDTHRRKMARINRELLKKKKAGEKEAAKQARKNERIEKANDRREAEAKARAEKAEKLIRRKVNAKRKTVLAGVRKRAKK